MKVALVIFFVITVSLHPTQFLQVQGLFDQPFNPDMSRLEDLYHTQPRQMSLQIQLHSVSADGYRFSSSSPKSLIAYHALVSHLVILTAM